MDPLSLTASIIALIQAAQAIAGGVQKFRNAPKEFSDLKSELYDLVKLLKQVCSFVQVIDDTKSNGEPSTDKGEQYHELLRTDEVDGLRTIVSDLKRVVDEIGKVVNSSSNSKGKLNRLPWYKKDGTLGKGLLQESRRLQTSLVVHLNTLPPMQL